MFTWNKLTKGHVAAMRKKKQTTPHIESFALHRDTKLKDYYYSFKLDKKGPNLIGKPGLTDGSTGSSLYYRAYYFSVPTLICGVRKRKF